jgi:uncharacterized protein YutE (UPF0331/DUF86 family)
MDDILLNKMATIKRCVARINDVYDESDFKESYTKQDSVILNLQRACEATIDVANFAVRKKRLGIPQRSRDGFVMLRQCGAITEAVSSSMQSMVGLRNIAVHDYQELNLEIVESVVRSHLQDFFVFITQVAEYIEQASD